MKLQANILAIAAAALAVASGMTGAIDAQAQRTSLAKSAVKVPPLPVRKPRSTTKAAPPSTAANSERPEVPPKPDQWSQAEITKAKAQCARILKSIDAVAIAQPAVKKGPCGDPAPIRLVSVGKKPQVALSPPPLINCEMAGALHKWIDGDLQRLAKRHLKGPIVKMEIMSGYSCRNAYGRKRTRLSEHGLANALDIRGFLTNSGQRTRLLSHWGLTKRDVARRLAEKKKREAEKAKALADAKRKAGEKQRAADTSAGQPAGGVAAERTEGGTPKLTVTLPGAAKTNASDSTDKISLQPSKLGGPKPKRVIRKARRLRQGRENGGSASSPQGRFLRSAHTTACRIFGTVLGPEANNAHRNHFHVDLAYRKRSNYCR